MPTVVFLLGWRLHFYANEGNEPIHIHAEKAEKECKYWLDPEKIRHPRGLGLQPDAA